MAFYPPPVYRPVPKPHTCFHPMGLPVFDLQSWGAPDHGGSRQRIAAAVWSNGFSAWFEGKSHSGSITLNMSAGRHLVRDGLKPFLLFVPGGDDSGSDLIDPAMKLQFLLIEPRRDGRVGS